MRTKIFTDTTCDLSPERRAAHDITALPLHVFLVTRTTWTAWM